MEKQSERERILLQHICPSFVTKSRLFLGFLVCQFFFSLCISYLCVCCVLCVVFVVSGVLISSIWEFFVLCFWKRSCNLCNVGDNIYVDNFSGFQISSSSGLQCTKVVFLNVSLITTHGRKGPFKNTGFSIQFCNISVESDVVNLTTLLYLGRPWKLYPHTVIMQSYIDSEVSLRDG